MCVSAGPKPQTSTLSQACNLARSCGTLTWHCQVLRTGTQFLKWQVPEFLSRQKGQSRSSYSFWIKGLTEIGFLQHAYALLRSGASGDLHDRE